MGTMRMPIFCWTGLATKLLIIAAFPILTATLGMLLLDRYLDFHFFTNALGGRFGLPPGSWRVLIWGGLRGGISVPLALSLPVGPHRARRSL